MSNILSYSDNTTGAGWIARDPYSGDDISKISDPNGDVVEYPRTAVPSPFARLDLVATAFETLASSSLRGAAMNHRLVSNALDVAQLLFNYSNFSSQVRMLCWKPSVHIAEMRRSSGAHALLADTLELFMECDKEAYNFSQDDTWYILSFRNKVIGSTSPATYTIGAPVDEPIEELMLEEGIPMYARRPRHLYERDADFIKYIVHWFNAFPEARRRMKGLYDYILVNLKEIRTRKPQLYADITAVVENPHALNHNAGEALAESLKSAYSPYTGDVQPRVLSYPLYVHSNEDVLRGPSESDFLLYPGLEQPEGTVVPLILKQGFTSPDTSVYIYVNKPWQDLTQVDTAGMPPEKRVLPGTSIAYPWLTVEDFFEDTLVELATPIDSAHFFDGNLKKINADSENAFLLPFKPLLFRYFPASFLSGNVAASRPAVEMRHSADTVIVTLRVPVKGGYVELLKTYRRGVASSSVEGRILSGARLSIAVFPFVRTGSADTYNIRLFEMLPDYKASLAFYSTGHADSLSIREPFERTGTRAMRTSYYEVDHSWDYARLEMDGHDGRSRHCGLMLPLWPEYKAGPARHVFSVDFGTTNSHVEYSIDDAPAQPLEFQPSSVATLVATLDAPGALAQAETLLDVEFIPRTVGGPYGFPMRTAIASNLSSDTTPSALRSVNIPFLYERKAFNGYKISTMLKWSSDTELAEQYLREIMLLIRARILLDNAHPANARIVYFYPVSMSRSLQQRYLTLWENLYMRYLDANKTDVLPFPESVAPAFFYHDSVSAGSDFVSIDIGGGSSDVVIYKADEERMSSNPALISSFRFAGDALFGDAFADADADRNPMLSRYVSYFSGRLNADPSLSYLDVILSDIMAAKRSRDIFAYLFSIETAPPLRGLSLLDRAPLSLNTLLRDDQSLKPIFVYFYTAIMYYVAKTSLHAGVGRPRRICFSGTGSKILNILGRTELVREYTEHLFNTISPQKYSPSAPLELMVERDAPKQVTCKGGIELERLIRTGQASPAVFAPRNIMSCKDNFSITRTGEYTNASIRRPETRESIHQAVYEFNAAFSEILSSEWREEFGITKATMDTLRQILDKDVPAYLTAAINSMVSNEAPADERLEDVPFFYPIIGIIRNTLIPALTTTKHNN